MRISKSALGAAFLTAMAFIPARAYAYCGETVYADQYYTDGTYTYVYGEPYGSGNTVTYYGYTTSATLAAALASAVESRSRVYLVGTVSSCPTSGTYQWLGQIYYIYISP